MESDSGVSLASLNELIALCRQLSAHFENATMGINSGFDDPELCRELLFEVEYGSHVGIVFFEVVQSSIKKVGQFGKRRSRFGDLLDQFDEVGGGERS